MTLLQLEHFVYTAEYKSLSTAATKLYTSHSTLSRSISSLENELGVTLITRSAKGITLTDAGKVFYDKALLILKDVEEAKKSVLNIKNEYVRSLTIGSCIVNHPGFFNVCRDFSDNHPLINLAIISMTPEEIFEGVLNESLDIGFTFSYAYIPSGKVFFENIEKGRFYAYAISSHPICKKKTVSFTDLPSENTFISDEISRYLFGKSASTLKTESSHTSSDIIMHTLNGSAVAILPEHIGDTLLSGCIRLPLNAKKDTYHTGILYSNSNKNPSLKHFMQKLTPILN